MKIGNRIKELRTKRGLTQEALASALGVTPQTVSKWECEVNFPDVALLPELSVFFGVSIDSLFSMTRADRFERIENRISEAGLLDDDEVRQIENILKENSSDGEGKGVAATLLAKLYNHQADICRRIAAGYAEEAVDLSDGAKASFAELSKAHGGSSRGVIGNSHRKIISFLIGYLGRNPENADACAMLIDNLLADSRTEEAADWTAHLEKIDATYRPLGYRYTIASLTGKEEVAVAAIAVLANGFSDDPEALMLLADIYLERADYEKSIAACRKAEDIYPSPKPTEPLLIAAHISELLGNYADAASCYREVLRVLKEEWGIVSGERVDSIRKEIKKLSVSD